VLSAIRLAPDPPIDPENGRKLGKVTPDVEGENVQTLKATVAAASGNVSRCITFTMGPAAPTHRHKPISEWVKK
jgi:hypothetical protein